MSDKKKVKRDDVTTVQIRKDVMKQLKLRAVEEDMPISKLLERLVTEALEDGKNGIRTTKKRH